MDTEKTMNPVTGRAVCVLGRILLCTLTLAWIAAGMLRTKPVSALEGGHYFLFYLNHEETALESIPYVPTDESSDFMLQDLMIRTGDREVYAKVLEPEGTGYRIGFTQGSLT